MPCSDGGPRGDDYYTDYRNAKNRLDERTDQLCKVMKMIKDASPLIYAMLPKDVLEWHKKHEEFDKARQK